MIKFDKDNSTALKGIAILLMLLHHNFREVSLFEKYTVSFFPFPQEWVVNAADMAKICVSIFAFISGYGLYLSCKKNRGSAVKWTVNRYMKTFSGYWLVWILSSGITQMLNGRFSKIFMQSTVWETILDAGVDFLGLANLFDRPTLNGTWWYMSAAFVFVLLTPLLVKCEENLVLILAGAVVFIRVIIRGAGGDVFPGGTAVYSFLTPFILGTIFARDNLVERIINASHKWCRLIIEVILLIISYKIYVNVPTAYYWEVKWGFIPLIVILFCVEYIQCIPGVKQILIFLGKHSMNVFLVHTFIRLHYLAEFTYSWGHFMLITAVLLAISVVISMMLEWIKKLIRYDEMIQKICLKIERYDL